MQKLPICLEYENTLNFHIGLKIRVSMWRFLSVLHPLQVPIPVYEKKIWIEQECTSQQENLYKINFPATTKKLTQLHNCIVY